jgi:hypothetical protein
MLSATDAANANDCPPYAAIGCYAVSDEVYMSIWPRVHGLRVHTRTSTAIPRETRPVVLVHGLGVLPDYMLPTVVSLATGTLRGVTGIRNE